MHCTRQALSPLIPSGAVIPASRPFPSTRFDLTTPSSRSNEKPHPSNLGLDGASSCKLNGARPVVSQFETLPGFSS